MRITGTATYRNGVFTVEGAGKDIAGRSDQFHFAYRKITGDVDLWARVAGIENTDPAAKGGVMIRGSLNAGAAHGSIFATPGSGFVFQHRSSDGESSNSMSAGTGSAPAWLKLERRGTVITAFASSDGVSWRMVGSQVVNLPDAIYIGLAVTSRVTDLLATGTFDNVGYAVPGAAPQAPTVALMTPSDGATFVAPASIRITADATDADGAVASVEFYTGTTRLGTDTASPYEFAWSDVAQGTYTLKAVATDNSGSRTTSASRTITVTGSATTAPLPTGWTAGDIGGPTLSGTATYANGLFTIEGAGVDIWDKSDQFHYAYRAVVGDVDVVARVTALERVSDSAKGGVMIRESLAANAAHVSMFTTAAKGLAFLRRPTTGATSAATIVAGAAPVWVRLQRRSGTITGAVSTDGATWKTVGSQALSLPLTFYVGLAVGSAKATELATATFANVSLSATTVTQRQAVFTPSADHASNVDRYVFEVFTSGADPSTAKPVGVQDLGKPAIVNGEIAVSVEATITGLPAGTYISTVRAVNASGSARSAPSAPFTR